MLMYGTTVVPTSLKDTSSLDGRWSMVMVGVWELLFVHIASKHNNCFHHILNPPSRKGPLISTNFEGLQSEKPTAHTKL